MIAFNLLNRARGPSLLGAIVLACMYILIPCDTLHAQSVLKAQRGITATYQFQYAGPELRAKIQRETDAPIVVRLQRGQAKSEYEARFIGNSSGRYDLRDWL